MINFGYAGGNTTLPSYQACNYNDVNDKDLISGVIRHNLSILSIVNDWNRDNNIKVYRLPLDLVPYGWRPEIFNIYQEIKKEEFSYLQPYSRWYFHPGSYVQLATDRETVLDHSVQFLHYCANTLASFSIPECQGKIQLHFGGVQGDKDMASFRFVQNIDTRVPEVIYNRLALENDHKNYTLEDVLKTSVLLFIPTVLNIHNHFLNSGASHAGTLAGLINRAKATWRGSRPIIDYSHDENGAHQYVRHGDYINIRKFRLLRPLLEGTDVIIEMRGKEQNCLLVLNDKENGRARVTYETV